MPELRTMPLLADRLQAAPVYLTSAQKRARLRAGIRGVPQVTWSLPRNDLPEPGYQWRARRYPWAERVLAAAEAEHGAPPRQPQIVPGLCECGCGGPTPIADRTDRRFGRVNGKPLRFIRGHNTRTRKTA